RPPQAAGATRSAAGGQRTGTRLVLAGDRKSVVCPGRPYTRNTRAALACTEELDEIKHRIEESFGPGALARTGALAHQGPLNWTGRMTLTRESKRSLAFALK